MGEENAVREEGFHLLGVAASDQRQAERLQFVSGPAENGRRVMPPASGADAMKVSR